jgi:Xaa-Pro aminopeptidase
MAVSGTAGCAWLTQERAIHDILIYGDSRSSALRHEVPLPLPDPIVYAERGGRRFIFAGALDLPRMAALGGFDVVSLESLGLDELLGAGASLPQALRELVLRACRHIGVESAVTPGDFPLEVADHLRAAGIDLRADGAVFDLRRRVKTAHELAGIRRAQAAADAAMAALRAHLRSAAAPTSEEARALVRRTFIEHRTLPHDMVVIASAGQGADPHDEGSGPIARGVPIVVDIFPRDIASGGWGDLTRTLCIGEPPAELVRWHADVFAAQQKALHAVAPGKTGGELNRIACEHLAAQGHPTRMDQAGGAPLAEGFIHYLGHGLGLELHEAPTLDEGGETLLAGDVITIEPGLYRPGFGGCRIEDVVLVTEGGYELLSHSAYELAP